MARKLIVFPLLLVLASATAVPGSESGGEEIRSILDKDKIMLADLFRLADLTSPTLEVARSDVWIKEGQTRQAGLYPNPALEFDIGELSTNNRDNRKEKVSLVQPLILGGRRGAAVVAARARQKVAVQQYQRARTDVFHRVHTLWAEQLYFQEANVAFEELLRVANLTLDIARTRFESRAAPESQVTKALLEVYELEVGQQQLAQEQAIGSAELSSLLGGLPIMSGRLGGTLEPADLFTGKLLDSTVLDKHPLLQAAPGNIQAAEASRRQAEAARSRILPAAERGLTQAQEGYRVGRLPFLELIDALRTLAKTRLRTLELRKDLIVAEAELMSLARTGPYEERGKKP